MEKYRLVCITSQGTLCWGYCNLDVLTLNDVSLNSLYLKYILEDSSEFINKRWLCPYCVFSTEVGDQQVFIEQWARPGSGKMMQIALLISFSDWKDRCIGRLQWSVQRLYFDICRLCTTVEANCGGLVVITPTVRPLGFLDFSDPSLHHALPRCGPHRPRIILC